MHIPLLQLKNISKSFADNRVLDSVSITIEEGKCYAVVGENGAGKSTLMKIIGGYLSTRFWRNSAQWE